MLGSAEMPIAILAWFFVITIIVALIVVFATLIAEAKEKKDFEKERERRDALRKSATDKIINLKA